VLFNSPTFIFLFLPLVLAGGLMLRSRYGVGVAFLSFMVVASLVFYSYTNPLWLALIVTSICLNFQLARVMRRYPQVASILLTAGIIFNLGLLGYFKYADFFILNLRMLGADGLDTLGVILPIGISFYTFQQIAYLVDVRRGNVVEPSFLKYAFFVSFFPQLIAGPIVHHAEIMPQLGNRAHDARVLDDLAVGFTIFFIGLAKKLLLADSFAVYANPVFAAADTATAISALDAWVATVAYALQIYFDFSGYSDMAIGLGRMFGLRLPVNFDSPYKSESIIEFWRRWHITLSRFLKDYLYIPLGGNRLGSSRRFANLLITMLLGGLWHGAGWGFVIWGALHGIYLCGNHALKTLLPNRQRSPVEVAGARLVTFTLVLIAWVPFRAQTLDGALSIWGAMVGSTATEISMVMGTGFALELAAGLVIAFFAPNSQQLAYWLFDRDGRRPIGAFAAGSAACAGVLLNNQVAEFLYFQF
jgi:D-alanyl-lipoteichoic acid acyltransferase DltB (MBOAT superfamily)